MNLQEIKNKLPEFSINDYFRHLKSVEEGIDPSRQKSLRVAFLRTYTVEMIEPILRLRLLLEGYNPEFFFGDYNQFTQEILNRESALYSFNPNIVIIMMRIEELLPGFIDDFGSKPYPEWEDIIRSTVHQLGVLAETLEKNLRAQIIFQNISLPKNIYFGLYDTQNAEGQSYLIHKFNHQLAVEFKARQGVFIWDFNRLILNKGYENIYDPKMWYTSKNPFKQSAYPQIADDMLKYIMSALGRIKKCIVLDLDNTLWGGIAGEDGLEGVSLGHDYPGSCYRDFQKGLLRLYHRGIILAVNSKNNLNDALEIMEKHPYMVLKPKHFAAMRINWEDKVSNLKAIAQDINIGIDSMIFIDDNPVECELVRSQCPECEVILLPEKKYLIPEVLNNLNGIENIRLTEEDMKKGEMYQAQIARKEFETSFANLDDFLKSLNVEVIIEPANNFSIPRISQLTQKTNQMNLTTRRYTEADIQGFVNSSASHVFSVASKDRFGDNGIVGVFILKNNASECIIDTFLLSCRVIGRKIEDAMIAFIAEFAKKRGVNTLIGEYIPTAKNKPAADMYEKHKFKKIDDTLFSAELEKQKIGYPLYIKLAILEKANG